MLRKAQRDIQHGCYHGDHNQETYSGDKSHLERNNETVESCSEVGSLMWSTSNNICTCVFTCIFINVCVWTHLCLYVHK